MSKKCQLLLTILLLLLFLSGCKKAVSPVTKTGVYFDTVISITLYESDSSKLIDNCFSLADRYEALLSKTVSGSDVDKINSSYMEWICIDEETYSLIKRSIEFEDYSDGSFSVMCGALTDLWDISSKSESIEKGQTDNLIPSESEIETAKSLCGKSTIDLDDSTHSVRINTKGARLDLGAVAKGYIADKMKEYLISQGVNSGIIQLGGNVLLIGENPVKEDGLYHIGISTPFYDSNVSGSDVITAVSEKDTSIVTSGNYQRYFEYEGKIYHHIIDLRTGYPADTELNSVTIITDNSYNADALSTVCFLLGKEKGANLLDSLSSDGTTEYNAVFIDSSNNITFCPQKESLL